MPQPGSGRKVRDAKEAHELLAAWSRSNMPMAAWCASRGISWYSLSAYKGWQRDALVEVETGLTAPPAAAGRYVVIVGDRAVEVDAHFDDDVLRRLLRVVASC